MIDVNSFIAGMSIGLIIGCCLIVAFAGLFAE